MKKTRKKNDTVYVAASTIHGRGLFANAQITTGKFIGTFRGPEVKRDGTHVLWIADDDNTVIGRHGTNEFRYLNHADTPNAEFDGFNLYAIKMIRKYEEIVINYDS